MASLVDEAFGTTTTSTRPFELIDVSDANHGRGVFATVLRARLAWTEAEAGPESVVIKLPDPGDNGRAAAASGAYRREALAYREVLDVSPITSPHAYLVRSHGDLASFVLADLGDHRIVDQLEGLEADDAGAVALELARFHRFWQSSPALGRLDVRRATPLAFDPAALRRGLDVLRTRWADDVGEATSSAFADLLDQRDRLVEVFASWGPVTLCHGDPRADNLAFDPVDTPVLYDWQQLAVQFGAADLAWLVSTSLTPTVRRESLDDLIAQYGTTIDDVRLGLVLPGLAVLLLCQREIVDGRTRRFIATSLTRIGSALVDLDVPRLRAGSPRG